MISTLKWKENRLWLLDQTQLPERVTFQECRDWQDVAQAIRSMVVRGAPAIGIAAAFGVVLAARKPERTDEIIPEVNRSIQGLGETRPTARNLFWALERMKRVVQANESNPGRLTSILLLEAEGILAEDLTVNQKMGEFGQEMVPDPARILTHCNAGALATGGFGTALGVVRAAIEKGKKVSVLADETRPLFQGARLTAWELKEEGIPVRVIPDGAAGYYLARGEVDLCLVGADRIAANGDSANKIGTYSLAVLARFHGIPFYVVAPTSTIDITLAHGGLIPIEERDGREVEEIGGIRVVPPGVPTGNPAFDVTPAGLITAIITERGIVRPPWPEGIGRLF